MTNSDPESSPTLSHSPKPRMRIIVLLVCGQPSDVYISIGPLRRLICYLFVDYPPMNINWAAPTIGYYVDMCMFTYLHVIRLYWNWYTCIPSALEHPRTIGVSA